MTVLFPPVLETQALAFPYYSDNDIEYYFDIRFPLPATVSKTDIKHLQVSLKYANTGESAVNPKYAPDRQTLFISAESGYFYQESTGNYILRVPYKCFGNGGPAGDTTYLVQVRFGSNDLWISGITGLEGGGYSNFASWRQISTTSVPSFFGEWSNVQKAYCYKEASKDIDFNFNDFMPQVVWTYAPVGDDPISQIQLNYSYEGFNGQVVKTEVFSGGYNEDNVFTLQQTLKVAPVVPITVTLSAVTTNNTVYNERLEIPSVLRNYALLPVVPQIQEDKDNSKVWLPKVSDGELLGEEVNDGVLSKQVELPSQGISNSWVYNVYRINTLSLDCIKIIKEQNILNGEKLQFKDYTCEMGEDYQYCICAVENGKVKTTVTDLYPFGDTNPAYARLMKMEYSYITSRQHQLRLMGNVSLNSLKKNTQDVFQTTLGSQYPFYSRPSKIGYRTFTINALITVNFDPTATFMRLDTWGTIKLFDRIDYNKYSILMSASPGLARFFNQVALDPETGLPIYSFVGPQDPQDISTEKCVELVNRCASSLIMNGLWWDDENGDSYLVVHDRDLIETQELSLSRVRSWANREANGEDIYQLGSQPTYYENFEKKGQGPTSIYDKYLHRSSGLKYGTNATDSLVFVERKFREKVMNWLSDGKPKLFRSETEGNMIVIFSGVSFSPYDKTNRMIYSMSATVTEIAAFTDDNLIEYNLIPTSIQSSYMGNYDYAYIWGQEDPNVELGLKYIYNSKYDIPNMLIGDASQSLSIDTYSAVVNGKPPYTFSSDDLPKGINIQAVTEADGLAAGIIFGYPIGNVDPPENIPPGYATLTVTDSTPASENGPQTASMQIHYGWMYTQLVGPEKLALVPNNGNAFVVGQPITPIDFYKQISGGVEPYYFSGVNLPQGISIDRTTGEIKGSYGGEIQKNYDEVTGEITRRAYIIVTDYVGQRIEVDVSYEDGVYPLTFTKLPGWEYDYTEVGVEIPRIDLNEGVYGGVPFTKTVDDKPVYYYKFSAVAGNEMPKGWEIGNDIDVFEEEIIPNGVIYGVPEESTTTSGEFIIQVEDAVGSIRQISIYYNRILESFKFVWNKDFDVLRNDQNELEDISVGSTVQGVVLLTGVSGGLQYTDGSPYRFESQGLLPNFKISNGGEITGKAQVGMEAHVAQIWAIDARGKKVKIEGNPYAADGYGINVSRVTSALTFLATKFEVKGLTEGVALVSSNVTRYDLDGDPIPNADMIPQSIIIKAGQEDFTITPNNFPDGITIIVKRNPIGTDDEWYFAGTPTGPFPAMEGWIQVSDLSGDAVQIPVYFDEIIGEFKWNPFPNNIIPAPGDNVTVQLQNLVGGRPTYNIEIADTAPDWVKENFSISTSSNQSLTGWVFTGQMPDINIGKTTVDLIATDADGKTARGQIIFAAMSQRLNFFIETNLRNTIFYRGVSVIEQDEAIKIVGASGGVAPYTFAYNGEVPGGFSFDSKTGSIYGTPIKTYTNPGSISTNLSVTDSSARPQTKILEEAYTPWKVMDPPVISAQVGGTDAATEVTYNGGKLYVNTGWSSPVLFEKVADNVAYSIEGTLPMGMTLVKNTGKQILQIDGSPAMTQEGPITVKVIVTIPKTDYNEAITKTVTITWESITGSAKFTIPSDLEIGPAGVGETITPIEIGQYLTGGTGPFNWTWDYPNTDLTLSYDATGRTCTIQGTIAGEHPAGRYTVTVTDRGNSNTQYTSTIYFAGSYPQLIISGSVSIPETTSGEEITTIDLNTYISGGVPPYTVSDPNGVLTNRGYSIAPDGITISGNASEYGRDAASGNLLVRDSAGQEKNLPISCGKIDGPLSFDSTKATGPITIKAGKINTTLPANELVKLAGGAGGGTAPYTFSEDTAETGWGQQGWVCSMGADGNFTSIKRPSTPTPAGSFTVMLTDAGSSRVYIAISFGEVTA